MHLFKNLARLRKLRMRTKIYSNRYNINLQK